MSLNRRKFLQNTCCLTAALLLNKHVCADSKNLPSYCSLQGGLSENGINLLRTSGNSDLDRGINSELFHLGDTFNVFPGFGFYEEINEDDANAFATTETYIPDTKGTVLFGKYLLSAELTRSEWGALAVAGIMAHEFGHIYQFQTEFAQRLTQSQATSKLLELHADYLSGYHIGLKRLRDGEIDAETFRYSFYLKGGYKFNSPAHHGTPDERSTAILGGYKMGLTNNRNIHQVAQMGVNFVQNI